MLSGLLKLPECVYIEIPDTPAGAFCSVCWTPCLLRVPLAFLNHDGRSALYFAWGGYCLPFFSTLGSQMHHSSSGTSSRTPGMWLPQPLHVFLSDHVSVRPLRNI